MRQIVLFFIRFRMFLLYALLMGIALALTVQTRAYPNSAFLNSANFLSGFVFNTSHSVSSYFNLITENNKLVQENIELRKALNNMREKSDAIIDSTSFKSIFKYLPARVVRNSYNSTSNILLIDKGENDSLEIDDGVVTPNGLLGVVDKVSNNYATVISILNQSLQISAQLKKTNHFGTLSWDGLNPNIVQLTEIPKIAPVAVGDSIISSGRSVIFPKGIAIGTIQSFTLNDATSFYTLQVELFNDMTNVDHVYIVKNMEKDTLNALIDINE